MNKFQKKGKWDNLIYSKIFLTFLGILIIFFIFNMFHFMNKASDTFKNKKNVEDKIIELEKSKDKFNTDILKLQTEKGVEESIREKFGLAKEGENMIMIVNDKNEKKVEESNDSKGFLYFFKNWFK